MEAPENNNFMYAIVALGTAILTLLGNFIIKKNDNFRAIKIAEITADDKEVDKVKEDLRKASQSIRDLNDALNTERVTRENIERKFEAVKVAYRIILKQYTKVFRDDPDSLLLLEELNRIIKE